MDFLFSLLGACTDAQKADKVVVHDEDASEMQLNAFEFRHYRTSLEPPQHKLLERVVNQWCAMLVQGKTLKVNDFEEKVYLDKDMLNLEYAGELFPLKAISKMEMFKDSDDMMMDVPWGLDVTFTFLKGDSSLRFNFGQERHRLNFALTLRILRTRDPSLDPGNTCEVLAKDDDEEEEEEEKLPFNKVVAAQRFNVENAGIPIVVSVSELKILSRIQSSSRHVYLEFFIRYPRQERLLYAKSPTTHIPQTVLAVDDLTKRKTKKKEDEEEGGKTRAGEKTEEVLCIMKFDMKNVKLKVPKVPHTIFGRLMAKDDYFPTVVGTFEFDVKKSYLQDKRALDEEEIEMRKNMLKKKKRGQVLADGMRNEPEYLSVPVTNSWTSHEEASPKIANLGLRVLGYVTDKAKPTQEKRQKKKEQASDHGEEGEEEAEEDDKSKDGDDEEEEAEDEEGEEDADGDSVEEGSGWGSGEEDD